MFKRIGRSQPPALPGGRETIYLQPARRSRFWARLALVLILGVPFVGFFSLLVSQVTTGEFAETRVVDTTAVALATPDVAAFVANDSRVLDAQAEAEATRIALVAQRNEAETALAEFDQKLEQADQQQREALLRERQRIENGFAQLQLDIQANDEDLRILRERLDAENRARAEEIRLAAEADDKRIQAIRDEALAMEEAMRIKQQTMWTNAAEVMTSALAWVSVAFAVIIGLIVAVSSGIVMVAWVQIQLENRRIVAAHRAALPSPPQHAPRREPPRREPFRYEAEESAPPPQPPVMDYATVEELMREWQAATLRRRPAPPTPASPTESDIHGYPDFPEVEMSGNTGNGFGNTAGYTGNGSGNTEIDDLRHSYVPRERLSHLPLDGAVPNWARGIMRQMLADGVTRTRIHMTFYNSVGRLYQDYTRPVLDELADGE